ncbi:DUF308 domain-containing protein [Allomesorhizobium camelthorni]|uniref:Cobalt ABC transporter permease n=1 Tax=Allomesorhizobium camelthorni TaxID=475069 RepID=A0A6G4WD43_9HYPH|nr:DUF308 domain-containing protein [Mesorhizobium camelthorni]NGO52156.1 cobalt ABC transporter permease [Mesorhizobium camelthorni]
MAVGESDRIDAVLTALRGLLMAVAALLAFIYPAQAVRFLVLAGGGLLLIDGALGLAAMKFSGPRTNIFWFELVRNGLSIAAGLIVLFSPVLLGIFSLSFMTSLVGLLAVLVGIMEFLSGFIDHERGSRLWPAMIGGGLYIVFGLALLFIPLSSAVVLVRIVTALMILYALLLFYRAWAMRTAPAA